MKNNWMSIAWIALMTATTLIDIYMMVTAFNWYALIGALCCGASAVLGTISLVRKVRHG